jgi:hypothetical protein
MISHVRTQVVVAEVLKADKAAVRRQREAELLQSALEGRGDLVQTVRQVLHSLSSRPYD